MLYRSMRYVCHIIGFILMLFGFWWLAAHISGLPDYKLVVALTALTVLIISHFRWWRLSSEAEDREIDRKVNHIIVSNYLVMLLLFVLLNF